MKKSEVLKEINNIIEQLGKNAETCLENKKPKDAEDQMNYATGVRMVRDVIEYLF